MAACITTRLLSFASNHSYLYCLCLQKSVRHNHGFNVLGIETSCDDTGAAVVNSKKEILGESLNNQGKLHRESVLSNSTAQFEF